MSDMHVVCALTSIGSTAASASLIILPLNLVVFRCSLSLCVVLRCSRPTGGLSHRLDTASLYQLFSSRNPAALLSTDALRSQLVRVTPHASYQHPEKRASQHAQARAAGARSAETSATLTRHGVVTGETHHSEFLTNSQNRGLRHGVR
eukprot:COSAG03_NODE_3082_length_2239_cov_1.631308_5_plen_148_part_00